MLLAKVQSMTSSFGIIADLVCAAVFGLLVCLHGDGQLPLGGVQPLQPGRSRGSGLRDGLPLPAAIWLQASRGCSNCRIRSGIRRRVGILDSSHGQRYVPQCHAPFSTMHDAPAHDTLSFSLTIM